MFSYSISDNNVPCLVKSLHPTAKMDINLFISVILSLAYSFMQVNGPSLTSWPLPGPGHVTLGHVQRKLQCASSSLICFTHISAMGSALCSTMCMTMCSIMCSIMCSAMGSVWTFPIPLIQLQEPRSFPYHYPAHSCKQVCGNLTSPFGERPSTC